MTDSDGQPATLDDEAIAAAPTAVRPTLELLRRVADDSEITTEVGGPSAVVFVLPGTHKLKTHCLWQIYPSTVVIEAFVCRHPDEDKDKVNEFLLRRNSRLHGIAYSLDANGDIYLTARIPTASIDEDAVDRILGSVATTADGDFDQLLRLGFHSAIRREWSWRVSRGESLRNLQAFTDLCSDLEQPAES